MTRRRLSVSLALSALLTVWLVAPEAASAARPRQPSVSSGAQQLGLQPNRITCATTTFCVATDEQGHTQTCR